MMTLGCTYLFFLALCLGHPTQSAGTVIVMDIIFNRTVDLFADWPAYFGPDLDQSSGFKGLMMSASPSPEACFSVSPPPPLPVSTPPHYAKWIALIMRGNCTFETKVLNAQKAGYSAVIVMNVGSDELKHMSPDPNDNGNVTIPSVFVGETDGETLNLFFKDYHKYGLILTGELPFDIQSYLLPFAITVGICFLGMLIFMIVKCIRDYRHSLRHRLSWRALRQLPIHKFRAEDPYEVCAICLEDYVEGDKLRVLPCNHAYHSRCIDPWLTKRRRVCPVCKAKVRTGNEQPGDDSDLSDSDNERSTSERAPLLHQATQVSAGTFATNRENPFQRANRLRDERRQQRAQESYDRLQNNQGGADNAIAAPNYHSSSSDLEDHPNISRRPGVNAQSYGPIDDTFGEEVVGAPSMGPSQGEQPPPDELDVVTITRSVRRNKKRKRGSGRRGSSEGESSGAVKDEPCLSVPGAVKDDNNVVVVQVESPETENVNGDDQNAMA